MREEVEEFRGDDDWFVGDDPGDGLLAAGLGQAPLVLNELRRGGDEGGEGHGAQAGAGAWSKTEVRSVCDLTVRSHLRTSVYWPPL